MRIRAFGLLALAGGLLLGAAACTDITTQPKSTVNNAIVFSDTTAYRAFLAKLYAGLSVTGMDGEGGAGNGDVGGVDEGTSQYLRQYWQLQELPTDEAVIGWGDPGLPEINSMEWGTDNTPITALYYRVYFQIALANEFLRQTSDEALRARGVSDRMRAEIQQYRAEARFLRALSYWHGLDLFGNIPLVTDSTVGVEPPHQATPQQIFDFIESELTTIRPDLPPAGQAQYGRADQGALDMLLAHVYLNAEVYTGQARWSDARAAAEAVIGSGAYSLDPSYQNLFLTNNNTSPEIIFPVTFDGNNTRTWGGMTYLVHAAVGGSMDPANYGINGGWWGLRVTPELVALFPGGAGGADPRSNIFYTQGQSLQINALGDFTQGYAAPKFKNVSSTGAPGVSADFPDTDFPMFRLADAYLMYAEAVLRGGGGSRATALQYVNDVRERAYGGASGDITDAQLTLQSILDERARELFWEGFRRQDLIRFGLFTGGDYLWTFKGDRNNPAGEPVAACLKLYPIPAQDLAANPNLTQNDCY